MIRIHELAEAGQSIWLDYIRRVLITSGELQALINKGLRGITSNPTIFDKVISGSSDYDEALQCLAEERKSDVEIYEALVIEDIQDAADVLRPVYEKTKGLDGYVSLEVSPLLANDTDSTVNEAKHLFEKLDRPNVMIKVPATKAGIPAIQELIGEGININVTLIFSLKHYQAVAEAYMAGLEKLLKAGGDLSRVASVASFFVSRIDTAIDARLESIGNQALQGKIAIAGAKVVYDSFLRILRGERWSRLAGQGARIQRLLWGSTGTKNPIYSDTYYVDNLIGPDTVNTLPPATLDLFLDHGKVALTLGAGLEDARDQLNELSDAGIDLNEITQKLQDKGIQSFAKSFDNLIHSIAKKRRKLMAGWQHMSFDPGSYKGQIDRALNEVKDTKVMGRIRAHDHTVWKSEPTEIRNRLGWLDIAEKMVENVGKLEKFAHDVCAEGYTHALLLGMGGSSLAPEVFRKTFGLKEGYLDLAVLDSTDPGAVISHVEKLNPEKTLFIVSSKSGTTAETLSFFKFYYNWVVDATGSGKVGEHFVAITDPGSLLVELADQYKFRATFINDPTIGGRYAVLSYVGLVPAALIGMDISTLLDRSMAMQTNCDACNCPVAGDNNGARLGAVLGSLAEAGRNKLTFVMSSEIASFGDWAEQLIAESTGKEGKGIFPVVGEPLGLPEMYGDDRLFIHIYLKSDEIHEEALRALAKGGHPVVHLCLNDLYDLGGQFFLWEMATAVAGHLFDINPFDQPNVEESKILARKMVDAYMKDGILPAEESSLRDGDIKVYGGMDVSSAGEALRAFLEKGERDSYIAIQAYVTPSAEFDQAFMNFRTKLRDHYKLATSFGYGPRFLHSTGQLHKGDAGNGLFIQFSSDNPIDVSIPDEAGSASSSLTFGVLKMAQLGGDRRALIESGRRVILFHLSKKIMEGIKRLTKE